MHITLSEFIGPGWRAAHYAKAPALEHALVAFMATEELIARHRSSPIVRGAMLALEATLGELCGRIDLVSASDVRSQAAQAWGSGLPVLHYRSGADAISGALRNGIDTVSLRELAEVAAFASRVPHCLPALLILGALKMTVLDACRTIMARPDWLAVACDALAEKGEVPPLLIPADLRPVASAA